MIVPQRERAQVAVEIQNDIVVLVHKEVAFALLCVHTPLHYS